MLVLSDISSKPKGYLIYNDRKQRKTIISVNRFYLNYLKEYTFKIVVSLFCVDCGLNPGKSTSSVTSVSPLLFNTDFCG